MEKNPAVSVIVPVYNVEIYIKQCVDSILNQTFQDFEIILVDDASPDNSIALCQKFYGDNDKIKFVHHEKNLGLGPARNTGIKNARGKYVYFVDSDDFILPDTLEKFYNAAEKTNAQVVHATGYYLLTQDEVEPVREENLRLFWDRHNQEGFLSSNIPYRLDYHWKENSMRVMAWLHFCRRDFLLENDIEFLPILSEDEPFSFALFCLTERYYILQAAVYVYRKRTGSIMTSSLVDRLAKGINSTILGALYIEQLIECISRFSNYDLWRENILNEFFNRFSKNHTLPHYRDSENIFEINKVIKDALLPFFGANEPFVKYFFNGFHIFRRQAEELWQQNQRLSALPAFLVRDQQNMLRIMDSIRANSKRIFVMGTPAHGNLGDQAIVWGELTILKNYFPDHEVIDIPYDYLTGGFGEIFWGLGFDKFVCDTGTIFLHGGGNLGNLWVNEEELRRKLIEKFPDNKIVIFPQSICFTADDDGLRELALSTKIYNAHEDLHLMLRDENSFNLAQEIFPNVNKYLMPDAATSLHGILDEVQIKREGVLFVLRGDKEKVRDDKKIEMLQATFHNANIPFEVVDTVINERITELNREQKVRDVLIKIRQSKLVITDRFHGVIFSFITRTPVLAFKSFDTKISSGIKWFENVPSVFYAEDENWAHIGDFINRALGDDMPFAEMNPKVKFDSREIFLNALNQIVNTSEVKTANRSTPPRLPVKVNNRVKRIFTLAVPLSICNLRCHYCYLAQRAESYQGIQPEIKYSPEQVAAALSPKRLGGLACFNVCADGETLLLKDLDIYMRRLAEAGHFIEIVTNCTITPMLEKFAAWDKELLGQVEFKCSFHYLELKKKNMLELFARNVNKIWEAGASICVEITPSDELIPYIDEVKEFSLKNFGALPHITIARDDRTAGIDILSKLSKEEYYKTWRQFDSPFFDYKATIFGKQQEEFCYAGLWSGIINLSNGQMQQCYCGVGLGDVFANPHEEFPALPVGKCSIAHCYNGHFWLTFGNIPHATNFRYADMRNRVTEDGREWLQPKLKEFFSSQLCDNNRELSDAEKLQFMVMSRFNLQLPPPIFR